MQHLSQTSKGQPVAGLSVCGGVGLIGIFWRLTYISRKKEPFMLSLFTTFTFYHVAETKEWGLSSKPDLTWNTPKPTRSRVRYGWNYIAGVAAQWSSGSRIEDTNLKKHAYRGEVISK